MNLYVCFVGSKAFKQCSHQPRAPAQRAQPPARARLREDPGRPTASARAGFILRNKRGFLLRNIEHISMRCYFSYIFKEMPGAVADLNPRDNFSAVGLGRPRVGPGRLAERKMSARGEILFPPAGLPSTWNSVGPLGSLPLGDPHV